MIEIQFYGAAGEITGSCHIVRVGDKTILLDCGMIQGGAKQEARNAEEFAFNARDIDAVVLSHAHIDHSGRLPLLVKRGFNGPIHAHNATKDLCNILLADSASLNQRDVAWRNRRLERQGKPLLEPLYTMDDVADTAKLMVGHRYREIYEILPGVSIRFQDAGHILGSTSVELWLTHDGVERKLVFSGDLGQYDTPILHDPAVIEQADVVLMESTYGGRVHRDRVHTHNELGDIIKQASGKGNIIIPAFAIGRSQEVLYVLGENYANWEMHKWKVFLDSPMAIEASQVYWDYPHLYDDDATKLRQSVHEMPRLKNLYFTSSTQESMQINDINQGAIIIAGSGMCNGGRILHHLKRNLWRPESHVVIVGYQSPGTLGRKLVDGNRYVAIHDQDIKVRATVHTIGGLSAHADENDLLRWFGSFTSSPEVFLVHGEEDRGGLLAKRLRDECNVSVNISQPGWVYDIVEKKLIKH